MERNKNLISGREILFHGSMEELRRLFTEVLEKEHMVVTVSLSEEKGGNADGKP